MVAELDRAEQKVEDASAALRKELSLRDLVLTQILFVVGSSWVGAAAKLGQAHLVFWLLAIVFFYIPQAAVVIYLNRLMPLEGGLYQWAKLGFNEFVGFIVAWNLWLLSITVIALGGMFVTTNISYALGQSWMPNSKWCVSLISCALVLGLAWSGMRGLCLGKWVHNIGAFAMLMVYGALIFLPFFAIARGELLRQYFHQTRGRRAQRIRIRCDSCRRNPCPGPRHRPVRPHRVSRHCLDVHSRHELRSRLRWK